MAAEDRTQAHDLSFAERVTQDTRKIGLFPLVRGLEARLRDRPRVGQSKRPDQNIVDLAQAPFMGFADSTLTEVREKGGRTSVRGTWLGLTGPMGPLPTHLTEFAYYERRYASSQPFGDWLDLLAGRMLQLFYRAWASAQPAASADRPEDDAFAGYLSALSGAMEGASDTSAFPRLARAHYAPLFAGSRNAGAIEDSLSHLLGQPVRLLEFQGTWRAFEPEDRSRLGRSFSTLGSDVFLGNQVRSAADAFRVVIKAKNYRDYRSLLPSGPRFAVAAEALDAFKPTHLDWDICVEIDDRDAPPARLAGQTPLGWASWIKPRSAASDDPADGARSSAPGPSATVRADAHLRKTSRRKKDKIS